VDRKYLNELTNIILNLDKPNEIEKYMPHMSAYQFIYESNRDSMGRYAMNYLGRRFTYEELFSRIDLAAKGFAELGVKPKDRVGMSMLATPEAVISFYALNKIGALVYMINGTHEKPSLKQEIADCDADLLIINDIFYDKDVSEFCKDANIRNVVTVSLDESTPIGFYGDIVKFKIIKLLKKLSGACYKDDCTISWKEFINIANDSILDIKPFYERNAGAVIAGTSGSTGVPSHPVLTNDGLNANSVQMAMSYTEVEAGDANFTTLPMWIIYTISNCLQEVLAFSAELELDPIFDSKHVSKRFKQYRFNHWNTIPAYIEDMVHDKGMKHVDLENRMKTITTGGDFRSPKLKLQGEEVLRKSNSKCIVGQAYGSTQKCGCFAGTYKKDEPAESIGRPIVGNKFKIIDDMSGEELGPNSIGELYAYTPSIMICYDKNPDKTKEDLITDNDGVIWFKTGDYAYYDEEGRLYICGRKRRIEMTKDTSGNVTKYFPDKVKQVISLYPSIEQCEIVSIPDLNRIAVPIAYVVLSNLEISKEDFIKSMYQYCINNNLEPYTIPVDYVFVDEIPKKPSLKVDYEKMVDDYLNHRESNNSRKRKRINNRRG